MFVFLIILQGDRGPPGPLGPPGEKGSTVRTYFCKHILKCIALQKNDILTRFFFFSCFPVKISKHS